MMTLVNVDQSIETPARTRRRPTALAGAVALLLGAFAAMALLAKFTSYDDPCPAYDDEGPMAAPGSPYSRVMCRAAVTFEPVPMEQVELPAALLVAVVVATLALALLVWRRPRITSRRTLAAGIVGVLLVQPLLVVVLQYALPRDCLSGRTETGECSRDREQR